jgi:hypothetical protein
MTVRRRPLSSADDVHGGNWSAEMPSLRQGGAGCDQAGGLFGGFHSFRQHLGAQGMELCDALRDLGEVGR